MKKILILIILELLLLTVSAQDKKTVDSLLTQLEKVEQDTTRVNILSALSEEYWGSDHDKAKQYNEQALRLAKKIDYKLGISEVYRSIGVLHAMAGENAIAEKYFRKSLKLSERIGDKWGVATCYNNIAILYDTEGNYAKALEYYKKSLKMNLDANKKSGVLICYNNLGVVYQNQGN